MVSSRGTFQSIFWRKATVLWAFTAVCAKSIRIINLSQETEDLAQRLAAGQRVSFEDAIRQALEARARATGVAVEPQRRRDQSLAAVAARKASVDRIVTEIASMPILDPHSPREIMDDLNEL
jgi:antitoxin VapB